MLLSRKDEKIYPAFINGCVTATFFHTLQYRNLLADILHCEYRYLIAKKDGEIVGALPLFLKRSNHGNILNSLPFFGSNGGFLATLPKVKNELLEAFLDLAQEEDCILSTIISSYLDRDRAFYDYFVPYQYKDTRTTQLTEFKKTTSPINEILYHIIEKRNRATIRKPIKNGITVETSDNFDELYKMQKEDIMKKNGIIKPYSFYQNIPKHFDNNEYKLIYAKKVDETIAGLLLFYFKDMVEYFSPAFYLAHKSEQGLSLLIYEAMKDAIERRFLYWNWGGIRKNKEKDSLYFFKRGWGGKDFGYYYYHTIQHDVSPIGELSKEEIQQEYPYFYVLPYSEIKK